jgi:hypothetical protein
LTTLLFPHDKIILISAEVSSMIPVSKTAVPKDITWNYPHQQKYRESVAPITTINSKGSTTTLR